MAWSLAIDFGTSNTAAAYQSGTDKPIPVRLSDQAEQMPSAVLALDTGILVGAAAVRSARLDPPRFEPNPKRRVGEGEVLLGNREYDVAELVAAVLTQVRQRAARVAGDQPLVRVILTYPEQWAAFRREVVRQAAIRAGFDPATIDMRSEPVAAASWYASVESVRPGETVAVFDFGGGTCDVAVLQATEGGGFAVLAAAGADPLGGEHLDQRLLDWTLEQLTRNGYDLLRKALQDPTNLAALLNLKEQIRQAKHELADYESARIPVALGSLQSIVTITAGEFDALISADIDQAMVLTTSTLRQAGIQPSQLRAMYLTGGSSHLRLVHRRMTELLGRPPATLNDPKLVVAQGALVGQLSEAPRRPVPAPTGPVPMVGPGAGARPGGGMPPGQVPPAGPTGPTPFPTGPPTMATGPVPQPTRPMPPPGPMGPPPGGPPPGGGAFQPAMGGPPGPYQQVGPVAAKAPAKNRATVLAAVIAAVVVAAAVGAFFIFRTSSSANDPTNTTNTTTDTTPADSTSTTPTTTTTTSTTTSTTTTTTSTSEETKDCWDGSAVGAGDACPALEGKEALEWVFGATDAANRTCKVNTDSKADGEEDLLYCTFPDLPNTAMWISRWVSTDRMDEYFTNVLGEGEKADWFLVDEPDAIGTRWDYQDTADGTRYRAYAYKDYPFSVQISTLDPDGKNADEVETADGYMSSRVPASIANLTG